MKYRYVYYWICIDLCNGGLKRGPYNTKNMAMICKPCAGLWQLKKKRVMGPIEYLGYNIEQTLHGQYQVSINGKLIRTDTLEKIKQVINSEIV